MWCQSLQDPTLLETSTDMLAILLGLAPVKRRILAALLNMHVCGMAHQIVQSKLADHNNLFMNTAYLHPKMH
jgi:hypothetical protein